MFKDIYKTPSKPIVDKLRNIIIAENGDNCLVPGDALKKKEEELFNIIDEMEAYYTFYRDYYKKSQSFIQLIIVKYISEKADDYDIAELFKDHNILFKTISDYIGDPENLIENVPQNFGVYKNEEFGFTIVDLDSDCISKITSNPLNDMPTDYNFIKKTQIFLISTISYLNKNGKYTDKFDIFNFKDLLQSFEDGKYLHIYKKNENGACFTDDEESTYKEKFMTTLEKLVELEKSKFNNVQGQGDNEENPDGGMRRRKRGKKSQKHKKRQTNKQKKHKKRKTLRRRSHKRN